MLKTITRIGPKDHGRRMSLNRFEPAIGQEGYLYELGRGRVVVMDVPGLAHMLKVDETRNQLTVYRIVHPDVIFAIAGGSDCKILLGDLQSERHPDLAVYLKPPPDDEDLWSTWIPELVIEIVSPGSKKRDYLEKPEEYLAFGISEYWVVDADKQQILVMRRFRGRWSKKIVRAGTKYKTTLLPGFELDCRAILAAGEGK